MSNSNLKGRATAAFTITATNADGVVTMTVTAASTSDEWTTASDSVNGTVALGKAIAELGKVATPITASERKLSAQVALYLQAGMTEKQANKLAASVNNI